MYKEAKIFGVGVVNHNTSLVNALSLLQRPLPLNAAVPLPRESCGCDLDPISTQSLSPDTAIDPGVRLAHANT